MTGGRMAVRAAACVAALWFAATPACVQAKPPVVTSLFPAGARQGTTVLVTASGTFDRWPVGGWSDGPGVTVEPLAEKGKLWVSVAEGTAPGVYWVRLYDEEGASALRPFVVGALPEVNEVEPNDDPARAQPLDRPAVTVNGRLARSGDVDGFAVALRRGETLVASVEANRRLGSPMDGLIQVARPDGIVLAANDDDHDRDPQLAFEAPADGTYVVRTFAFPATPDARISFSGAPTYIYRLTLTTRGFVDHPYPLAVARDAPGPVRAEGWNIESATGTLELRGEEAAGGSTVARASRAGLANGAEVRLVPHAAIVEAEPNPADAPQALTPPVSVTGRLDAEDDVDAYRFTARKGDKQVIRVESRALGQPLDPTLRVLNASGKIVGEVDDSAGSRDAELSFTAPEDGPFRVVVRDLNSQAGPRAVYLLTVAPPMPDFGLTLAADRFTLSPGRPLVIPVTVTRTNGFDGVVRVSASGLPEGVSAAAVTSDPKNATDRAVEITLKADQSAASWNGPISVEGRTADAKEAGDVRVAEAKVEGFAATSRHIWLTVVKAKPPGNGK
jgi:hypothetical protein